MSKKILVTLTEITKIAEGKTFEEINIGSLSSSQKKKLKKALRLITTQKTKGEDFLGTISLWHQVVMITLKLGWMDETILSLQMALQHNPTNFASWSKLAEILELERRYREAEDVYQTVLHNEPTSKAALYLQAMFYLRQSRIRESEESLRTALRYDPTDNNILSQLVELLKAQKKYDEVDECCRSYLHDNPTSGYAWYNIASVHYGRRRYEKALESLNKALSFAPPDDDSFILTVNQTIQQTKHEMKEKS